MRLQVVLLSSVVQCFRPGLELHLFYIEKRTARSVIRNPEADLLFAEGFECAQRRMRHPIGINGLCLQAETYE